MDQSMSRDRTLDLLRVTSYGPVIGFEDSLPWSERSEKSIGTKGCLTPVRKWLGIPYGEAGRFQRATPPQSWQAPLLAHEFSPAFPQPPSPFDELYKDKKDWPNRYYLGQSENGFTLNVFAPVQGTSDTKLPVLVWIHGGDLVGGSTSEPIYDPTGLVRRQQEVGSPLIVVTVNYRVGCFGWLDVPDLVEVNGHVGNFGFHDCILALQWIQSNIGVFGGDSRNVTAIGESAGAYLIGALLNSGRQLFQKAIMESGTHILKYLRIKPEYEAYENLLKDMNPGLLTATAQERIEALKLLSAEDLLKMTMKYFRPGQWSLTADPEEPGLSQPFWHSVAKGARDPWIESVMIGINKDEGSIFNSWGQWWKPENMVRILEYRGMLDEKNRAQLEDMYPNVQPTADFSNLNDLPSSRFWYDMAYLTPMLYLASSYSNPQESDQSALPVYVFHFDTMPSRLLQGLERYGILHTGEIPFVFNASRFWDNDQDSPDGKAADVVGRLWSSYAYGKQPWTAFSHQKEEILHIRESGETVLGSAADLRAEHREFWLAAYKRKFESGRPVRL